MRKRPQKHVVVAGAGPAGLLTAINLLRRGEKSPYEYTVTLVDVGEDFGALSDLSKKRSWMIGLSSHGLSALRRVPGLYESYVAKVGVPIERNDLYIGSAKVSMATKDLLETYVVDRNYIVAAMARYLNEHFMSSGRLKLMYRHQLLLVDPDRRRVLIRPDESVGGSESYVGYDLLVGCDGIRSAVRASFIANHRDFECSVSDIFNDFKSVHIDLPAEVSERTVAILPQCLRTVNGIAIPETGGKINVAMGYNLDQTCDEPLLSSDAQVVASYLRSKWRAFPLPWDDFAQQWVAQPWSKTGQVHCNFYHSDKLQALIMGDAAHATSPSIGQGMNTALEDAAVLDGLMDAHGDDISADLSAFSAERVKEGNALTDIAFYFASYDAKHALGITIAQLCQNMAHKWLPSVFSPDPYAAVAMGGKLSEAYNRLTKMGRLPAVRRVNDDARRNHFEKTTGMVTPDEPLSPWARMALFAAGVAVVGFAFAGRHRP